MRRIYLIRILNFLFILLLVGVLEHVMKNQSYADSLEALQSTLPDQINGWKMNPKDRFFDNVTIFDYIDGAGEVYRAYNMRRCLSRHYDKKNGPSIVMDIFDMGSSEDAFGVFTHDQDGESLNIGQDALYRPGWLSFWKDRFFVSIYAEEETAASQETVRDLGKVTASLIKKPGSTPRILLCLPSEDLQPRSIRYLHHHIVLNYHFYLADDNILNLEPQTHAVLSRYKRGKESARLLLVMYPDEEKAKKALTSFLKNYLPEAERQGIALLENGKWCAAKLKGRLLAIILEADSQQFAKSLLTRVKVN
jgi:hypothetical protein